MFRFMIGALFLVTALGSTGQSQTSKRWEVGISTGGANGSWGKQLKTALDAAGYDDKEACTVFCNDKDALGGASSWFASVRYVHRGALRSSLVIGESRQNVSGLMATDPPLGERLTIGTEVSMLAATAVLESGVLSVEAGPAAYRVRTKDNSEWENVDGNATKIGAMAGARLAILFKGFRITVSGQYRHVGSTHGGPYSTLSGSVPKTKFSFNHTYFGVGLARSF
jgi:hypothetical protein